VSDLPILVTREAVIITVNRHFAIECFPQLASAILIKHGGNDVTPYMAVPSNERTPQTILYTNLGRAKIWASQNKVRLGNLLT